MTLVVTWPNESLDDDDDAVIGRRTALIEALDSDRCLDLFSGAKVLESPIRSASSWEAWRASALTGLT